MTISQVAKRYITTECHLSHTPERECIIRMHMSDDDRQTRIGFPPLNRTEVVS